MNFRILGPVEGSSDGAPLMLGGPRQRALLAYLLLRANECVPADRLLDDLWWEPPKGGVAALQTQVSRLRKVVGDRLVSTAAGYAIHVEPDELDLQRVRALLAEAGAAHTLAERVRLLREVESLWHGEPLAEIDLPFVAGERAALEELRVGAIEERLAADVDGDGPAAVVPELAALIARYPLRERLRSLLMLALYRAGRQAEALEVARETRRILDEELGLEPSPALRELERAILQQDPSLAAPPPEPKAPTAPLRPTRKPLAIAAGLAAVVAGLGAGLFVWHEVGPGPAAKADAPSRPQTIVVEENMPKTTVVTHHARHRSTVRPRTVRRTVHVRAHLAVAKHPAKPAAPRHVVTPKHVVAPKHVVTHKSVVSPKHATVRKRSVVTTPKKPALQPDLVTLSDDFSAASTNYTMWGIANDGTGGTAAQQNGRLELTLPSTGATGGRWNQISVSYFSQCRFGGDFDAQVAFALGDWPSTNGARMQLSAWIYPNLNTVVSRTSSPNGEQYDGNVGSSWSSFPTTDQQGALRITRRSGTMTLYVQQNGRWVVVRSGTARGLVMLGLQLFATANDWSHQQVDAAFDNFTVTAQRPTCQ